MNEWSPVMDPFSEVLDTIHLAGAVHCHATLQSPWGFRSRPSSAAEFIALVKGSALLSMDELDEALQLHRGDLLIWPDGNSFTMQDQLDNPVTPLDELTDTCPSACPCHVEFGGNGPKTRLIAGYFTFDGEKMNPLLQALPPLLRVRSGESNLTEWLYTTIQLLEGETKKARPGSTLTTARLTEVLFIQALRIYFTERPAHIMTDQKLDRWLEAVTDRQIGRALAAIHERPDEPWTVEKLAREAFMSRTAFATRFTDLMGEPPMQYVTRWRLHTASEVLREDNTTTVAEAAQAAGYDSVSSFSKAFKREVGLPPGQFREKMHAGDPAIGDRL